ncbi:MAG: hypothetical protein ACE5KO_04515, partial [Candidatus Bathyarchaeia archaeon]
MSSREKLEPTNTTSFWKTKLKQLTDKKRSRGKLFSNVALEQLRNKSVEWQRHVLALTQAT